MSTIEILGWDTPSGGTAWDDHLDSELKKRMVSGVGASQKEIRRIWKQICHRELVAIGRVREEAVLGVTQILRAMGAEMRVGLETGNDERLFAKWPTRGKTKKAIKPARQPARMPLIDSELDLPESPHHPSAEIHQPRNDVTEAIKLVDVFTRLALAHHECGQQYVDSNLDAFVKQLEHGDFFSLTPEQQMSRLQWYDEAFIGRGGNLRGLVERNHLPKHFGDEMRAAIIEYLLATDVGADVKVAMRRYVEGRQNERP